MIKICGIIMVICGLVMLLIPKNKLYNPEKVKTQEEVDKIIKNSRTSAIIFVVLGLLFLFIY